MHPAEAVHGDVGIYTPGDPTIVISRNGASAELRALVPTLKQFRSPLIGILGSASSPLVQQMDVLLDGSVEREATLGQALELMERRRSQISVLPVVDQQQRALGLLRSTVHSSADSLRDTFPRTSRIRSARSWGVNGF